MKRSELTEFEFEEDGFKLRLSRQTNNQAAPIIQSIAPVSSAQPISPINSDSLATKPIAKEDDPNVSVIKSPMVGTFYLAPSPESPNFVEIGSKVISDSIVCIVEAMKVMNEIQAEANGTITEILVENGQSIEFGQPLFKYKRA